MKNLWIIFLTLFIANAFSANRPYNEVVKEFSKDDCTQKKENILLSQAERESIEKMSMTKLYGGLALRYITKCSNGKIAFHYIDSHIVRTLNETIVVTIEEEKIDSFIVSSFNEPPEYIAPKKWYAQFNGTKGDQVLRAREQIDALSGATLTVNASINAANKILALHKLLKKRTKN